MSVFLMTIVYALFALIIIIPPTEFVAAGITIESLFGFHLGIPENGFILYQMKRICVTLLCHSLLPLGYCYVLSQTTDMPVMFDYKNASLAWIILNYFAILLPLGCIALTNFWSHNDWNSHPIAKMLSKVHNNSNWKVVARSINAEYARYDKFIVQTGGFSQVILTDWWIIKVLPYWMHIVYQGSATITIANTDEHEFHPEGGTKIQFINIKITSESGDGKTFMIRLNSLMFQDLQDKLQSPIHNTRNVIIRQSLTDQFLDVFQAQVQRNQPFLIPENSPETEMCIGCLQNEANIKLQKLCDEPERGDCQNCNCRPMWCMQCMGKWFAHRQDQSHPETWLQKKSPCPTCRSKFCVLDVSLISSL